MIYMDNAATTRISEAAAKAMLDTMTSFWGNPSSHHQMGYLAKGQLKNFRKRIALCLGAKPQEIFFTSGGSESDNWALESAAKYGEKIGKKHIISSAFEHHAILNKLKELEERGFEITLLKPDCYGLIRSSDLSSAIREDTVLVSIMAVNNEVGSIQDIESFCKICKEKNIIFHTDAVQGIPHLTYNLNKMDINMLSASAHKFNGPRGIGFLYVKEGTPLFPLIYGGAQEQEKRAGTENLPAIAGMTVALEERKVLIGMETLNAIEKKDALLAGLSQLGRDTFHLNGSLTAGVPTTINFCFTDIEGETLLNLLSTEEIYCSAGSACSAGDPDPSHVLLAMGLSPEMAKKSLRLSFDYNTSMGEINETIEKIKKSVGYIRGVYDK